MSTTSNTHFYSLSLDGPALPARSSQRKSTNGWDNFALNDKKDSEVFRKEFVRRYTPPYSTTDILSEKLEIRAEPAKQRWNDKLADLIVNWWLWELFSWGMSALCIFAIAVMLGYYDGQNIPTKWPLGITLNAYIAVLSGIAKYMLAVPIDEALGQLRWHYFGQGIPRPLIDFERFDDASRGPWGALALLIHTRGRSLASLGASITLLALALDPFFQQLVAFPQRPSTIARSTVPTSVRFDTQGGVYLSENQTEVIGDDRWMTSVVIQFMQNNGSDPGIFPFCPSGDCAWRPFDTLGICSKCADISDMITFACLEESGDWKTDQSQNDTAGMSCGYFFNATGENPVLMSGYSVGTSGSGDASHEALVMRNFNLRDVNYDIAYWGGSLRHKSASFPIIDFALVASTDVSAVYRNETPTAQECVLQWCTKRIVGSSQQGNYTEMIVSTMTDPSDPFDPMEYQPNFQFEYHKNITIKPPDQPLTFFVPNQTVIQTIFLFQDISPSFVTAANETMVPLLRTRNEVTDVGLTPRYWKYPTNPFAPPNDISAYVEKMSTALTNVIRTYPNSSQPFYGSGSFETYIHVNWGFFALPLALSIVTLVFILATIFDHRKQKGIGIWKTSSVAMLANGLDNEARNAFGPTDRLLTLFERSAEIKATLHTENGQTRLMLS